MVFAEYFPPFHSSPSDIQRGGNIGAIITRLGSLFNGSAGAAFLKWPPSAAVETEAATPFGDRIGQAMYAEYKQAEQPRIRKSRTCCRLRRFCYSTLNVEPMSHAPRPPGVCAARPGIPNWLRATVCLVRTLERPTWEHPLPSRLGRGGLPSPPQRRVIPPADGRAGTDASGAAGDAGRLLARGRVVAPQAIASMPRSTSEPTIAAYLSPPRVSVASGWWTPSRASFALAKA